MDSKYGDRRILCKYNLSTDFLERCGLKAKDIVPMKKGYLLECENGIFYMKKIYNEDSIRVIRNLLENSNEFAGDYSIFTSNDFEQIYYFLSIPSNTICTLSDVKNVTQKLAYIHKNCTERELSLLREFNGENLKELLNKHFNTILFYKKIVDEYTYKSDFDELFIENIDQILKQINTAINDIEHFNYSDIAKCLCLGNVDFNNILIKKDKCYFVDMEENYLGIGAINLAEFLLRILKNSDYDIEKGREVIEVYNQVRNISNTEFNIIYSYLKYPKDLIELILDYYNKNQVFDEKVFINKFIKVLDSGDAKSAFLKWFYDEYIQN